MSARTTERPACRQCGSHVLEDRGALPEAVLFAGQPLDPPWPGGRLWHCGVCRLGQRHPLRPEATYESLYASAPVSVWVAEALRGDEQRVLRRLSDLDRGASVLDVGCYDARLLAALPEGAARFGVEASSAAAARARERGVRIIGSRIRDLAGSAQRFDAILAIDVIEHVFEPRALVALLAALLKPGGRLIVSTGDFDAPAWGRAGGAYWYCAFPEHISFVSAAWAAAVAAPLGLELVHHETFAYDTPRDTARLARERRRLRRRLLQHRFDRFAERALGLHRPLRVLGEPGLVSDHVLLQWQLLGST